MLVQKKNSPQEPPRANDIIIKPADACKGSVVVILRKQHFINKTPRQLNDTTSYHQLSADPILRHISEVKELVSSMFVPGLVNKKPSKF